MKQKMKHILGINTILHTKDGRKIGNAIVVGHGGDEYNWEVKTDYGNILYLTNNDIDNLFYIAYESHDQDWIINCDETQKMMQETHKHRVETF
jgi:hypothetical protein